MTDQNKTRIPISLKQFFETVPPGRWTKITQIAETKLSHGFKYYPMILPELELHCTSQQCNGVRFFAPTDICRLSVSQNQEEFITYRCKNCGNKKKTFALWVFLNSDENSGEIYKFGEDPPFGPPTPSRLISLIGPEKEFFLKGRRSENQGLGIAAFAYYRRVIESQKNRILDEIIKVSEKLSASREILDDLKRARNETQFSSAVDAIKHGLPQSLLINGHNPLTLLHSALSDGLHAQTDEECLELATSIRVVIAELAERLAYALKDEAELNHALNRLLGSNSQKR